RAGPARGYLTAPAAGTCRSRASYPGPGRGSEEDQVDNSGDWPATPRRSAAEPYVPEHYAFTPDSGPPPQPAAAPGAPPAPRAAAPEVPAKHAPDQVAGDLDLHTVLVKVLESGSSDLHLSVGAPPLMRLHGDLQPMEGYDVLVPQVIQRTMYAVLTQKQRE